jgi:hypothetical protein
MVDIDVEHVLQLEQEFESARQTTIKLLLDRQKETVEQLKALGYEPKSVKCATVRERKPCSKCSSTEHDARFHRGERRGAQAEEKE